MLCISLLSKIMLPWSGNIFPIIKLNKVVFPDPLGPNKPTIFPASKVKEIFFKIGLLPRDLATR